MDKQAEREWCLSGNPYHRAAGELWYGSADKPNRLTTLALSRYTDHMSLASVWYGIADKRDRRG